MKEISRELLIEEFLACLTQRAEKEFKGKLHQAFVAWYIEAEFGRVKWDFTDNPNDGGIDAIVWRPGERPSVVIVQSKFSEKIGRGKLAKAAYRDFRRVVDAYYHKEDRFEEFVADVAADLRTKYRRAEEWFGVARS